MNKTELKEHLSKIDRLRAIRGCLVFPATYANKHNFSHNHNKILRGYPYFTNSAYKYLKRYLKTEDAYIDEYLHSLYAKEAYCRMHKNWERKIQMRRKKIEEREAKELAELEKYKPIAYILVGLVVVGIILFVVYIGNPIFFVLSVIFCAGTVILGLTGHGR